MNKYKKHIFIVAAIQLVNVVAQMYFGVDPVIVWFSIIVFWVILFLGIKVE